MKKLLMGVVLMGAAMGAQAGVTKYLCEQYTVATFDGVVTQHDFVKMSHIYDNGSEFATEIGNRSPALKDGTGSFKGYFFYYREPLNFAITDKDTGQGNTYENCKVVK